MKLLSVFRKSMREQKRDWVNLIMALAIGPFFVMIYWLMYRGTPSTYDVLMKVDENERVAQDIARVLTAKKHADGTAMLRVTRVTDRAAAEKRLKDRKADVLLIIPAGFEKSLAENRAILQGRGAPSGQTSTVVLTGDLTNARYMVAAVTVWGQLDAYLNEGIPQTGPIRVDEVALGASGTRSDFELYVPGLLMVAITMLIYRVAMLFTAEVEAGTLRRLQITRMSAFDLLGGISLTQMILGVAAVLLTFALATSLGFDSRGPLWIAVLIACIATFASVGIGLLVACFSKTTTEASIVGTFPTLLLMFFSGGFFPLPQMRLLTVGDRMIGIYDLLPMTPAVNALNKVMTLGAGLGEVAYEIIATTVLSALCFAAGVWLYRRKHLVAA